MVKISILTATYNSGKTLEQTISSIINQTYENIEYIIVDGGSTDKTIDIIKKYGDKIKWISEPDNGIYDALMKGVRISTGDYLMICGSDDCLVDYTIIEQVASLLKDKPDILSCNRYSVDEKTYLQVKTTNEDVKYNRDVEHKMIPTEGMVFSKAIIKKYPFDTHYKLVSDFKFFLQCYYDKDVKFKFSDIYVAYFSLAGSSSDGRTCIKEINRIYEELGLPTREKYSNDFNEYALKIKEILKNINWLRRWYLTKKYKFAKHHCNNMVCRWCHRL